MLSQLVAIVVALHHEATLVGTTTVEKSDLSRVEQRIVDLTNAERRSRGLKALTVDEGLMASARKHCAWMARADNLQHTTAAVAENIALGQQNASEALNSWMNSSGHRANILGRRWSRIGVAAYVASDGSIYWCQQFLE